MANLYGLWDWVGMALRMGPMSPVHAHSLWAGLCPEKAGKIEKKSKKIELIGESLVCNFIFYQQR